MEPKNIHKVKSIVNYHWSPKKRAQMQRKVNKITEPIENQTLEEVWETIRQRKEGKDLSTILQGMNLTRSYVEIVEDQPTYEERKVTVTTHGASQAKTTKRYSPARKASPQRQDDVRDWSFIADNDVLMKELDLGRELLNKAVNGITAQHLKDIVDAKDLTQDDKAVIQIMHGLIEVAADKENEGLFTWDQTHAALNENPY